MTKWIVPYNDRNEVEPTTALTNEGQTVSKEAETSHSQPLPHFRSFRSDLHLRSGVVRCWPRNQKLIGMTPERGRNEEGRGKKWDAFPSWMTQQGDSNIMFAQTEFISLIPSLFVIKARSDKGRNWFGNWIKHYIFDSYWFWIKQYSFDTYQSSIKHYGFDTFSW